jgi:hypothetical protein
MQRSVRHAIVRIAILTGIAAALAVAAVTLDATPALAAPALDVAGGCEPDPVRTGAAVMTCTIEFTNSGDETANDVQTSLFLSPNCGLPTPFLPPLLYLYVDGVLQTGYADLPLFLSLGDLAAGQSKEVVAKSVVQNLAAGRFGGELTVTADGLAPTPIDLCWTVDPGAAEPATDITLSKTLTSPPPGAQGVFNEATFEVVLRNSGSQSVTALSLIDLLPFGMDLASANPPSNASDPLGRPAWDLSAFGLSSLPPGAEVELSLTLRVEPGECAPVDNSIVALTTAGGVEQEHAAFTNRVVVLGDCSEPPPPPEPEWCLYWAPDESDAWEAPCDEPVCWSLTPGSDFYQPAFDCDAEYCWFTPPGEGIPALELCSAEVCWLNFDGEFEFYQPVFCDFEFCEFTSPDGKESFSEFCEFPICWSMPPEGGRWEPVFGCGEFGDVCWATPPFDGASTLFPCELKACFVTPPAGVIVYTFGDGGGAFPCESADEEEVCWPLPPGATEAFSQPVACEDTDLYCVFTPPDGGLQFVFACEIVEQIPLCWGIDEEIAGLIGVPLDTLIPRPCEAGEEPTPPTAPISVPAEVVQGVSTPVEAVEGTVEPIEPLPSAGSTPATLEPSSRVEPIDGPTSPPPDDNTPGGPTSPHDPSANVDDEPEDLSDVLGFGPSPRSSVGAPDSGYGPPQDANDSPWPAVAAVLAALGLASTTGGLLAARRRTGR